MLQFQNVQKYYGSFLAVNIPSLVIKEGIWWIKGENGSGKTTFLKMIAGLHPFTGDIILNEQLTLKKKRQQYLRLVNYAEAEPLYPSFLTARDLVELYCDTKGGDLLKAHELLKQLHVFDAYKKPLGSYSTGMIKKISLTLAFIGNPKIILLDEPLITIDAEAIETICSIISSKHRDGISFLITSHQPVDSKHLLFSGTLQVQDNTIFKVQ